MKPATKFFSLFLLLFLLSNCSSVFKTDAQHLPHQEVQTLKNISSKLNIDFWNVSQSSCTNGGVGFNVKFTGGFFSNVTCNCTERNNTVCHVTNIQLKGLNLTGVLPSEFGALSHLVELDLSRNYISGTIPTSFTQIPLVTLSLLGNRINGSIPEYVADISTLQELILDDNYLGGPIPEKLGNLSSLRRLLLSANNFTGSIPDNFGNLKNLQDFRIDGSQLSGKIPDLIGNWTNIIRLDMQGTNMEGPIPSTISKLTKLQELRISDLNASSVTFPDLQNMKSLLRLMLRNCSLTGSIPDHIGDLASLNTLDLSFNKLSGEIPVSLESLSQLNYMFLTNNLLSGSIPSWILNRKQHFDLSYNNFSNAPQSSCDQLPVNLASAYSSSNSNSNSWCLQQEFPCSKSPKHYSLFINCGGGKMSYDGHEYEEDLTAGGPSNFYSSSQKWAYSSTGTYMGNDKANFIALNTFGLNVSGAEFYKSARLAPLSLKYHGLCLRKGSYRVRLHFAEIMYSNDDSFSSLGRRIFDVSIQGQVVFQGFNIAEQANGVGKSITLDFPDIQVNDSTLVIHLYWAGKGTTAIPDRGVYGPLISAISVTPNFHVSTGPSAGVIAGIVIASCVLLTLILVVLRRKGYLGGKDLADKELRGLELQTGYFTLKQIKAATGNFDPANKIGEGGFGPVYKGVLSDGSVIAVKQLSSKSKQGNREFVNEIGMISALQHPNLVRLYGCCIEGNQLLLIYEYMENNCLARALFGHEKNRLHLDWPSRSKICMGIARGLAYLHEESRLKIVHRDIKASNVLLDKDLNAKISDFGLAKLDEEENTHISTRIAGTIGYMAPEYAMRGYLTDKADVYSFGVVLLEIVSGKSNTNCRPKEEFVYLLDWAYVLQEQGNLLELVDQSLGSKYCEEEAMRMLNLALLCANPSPSLRPSMSSAVSMLDGHIPVQAPIVKRSSETEEMRFRSFQALSPDGQTYVTTLSEDSEMQKSMSGPWIDSSISSQIKEETREHSNTTKLLIDL